MGVATKDSLHRSQAVIQRQVNTMALLLDDLLDVARITQGKLALRPESVSLVEVVGAAIEGVQPMLDGRRQTLDVHLPDNDLRFDADPLRITQVLMNLLTNASKYSGAGSHIVVEATVADSSMTLSVKDEGIGIPPEALATVFEMFSQLDSAHRRAEGGLGIGLALVKGLVELHGGQVAVKSEGSGRGSTFSVTLPLRAGACALEPVLRASEGQGAGKLRVLVADDSRDSADVLANLLELFGHEVRVAYDGRAAVTAAQAFRPDVALLDIGMPELNGYQVATRIRREAWGSNVVLVALTGWGGEHDKVDAEQAGFDRHLTKPVDTQVLQGVLDAAARGRLR
jgi:CheY-like chemotaxis protein